MTKRIGSYLFLLLIFTACKALKTKVWLSSGAVLQENFIETLSFENKRGYVIVPVQIDGNNYDFLLDTGAPNVLSKELADQLKLKQAFKEKIIDSSGDSDDLSFVRIPKLKLGKVEFKNTGAVIADLNANETIACFEIDGILGNNLMQKLVWQIDYKKQVVRFTDNIGLLHLPDTDLQVIPFYTFSPNATPITPVVINELDFYGIEVDFGSNGNLVVPRLLLDRVDTSKVPMIESYGSNSLGLFNQLKIDTINHVCVPDLEIGDVTLKNEVVAFTSNNSGWTLGTGFFKNYRTTIDWENRQIILEAQQKYVNDSLYDFGFSWMIQDHQLIVAQLFYGTQPYQSGLKLGDQIIEFNGQNVAYLSNRAWCDFFKQSVGDTLNVKVLLDGEPKSFTFYKEKLL